MIIKNFKTFKAEKLLFVSNIAVMTITFLVFGVFISLVALSQTALRQLEKQAQVTLFFKDEFLEPSILKLEEEIRRDERIAETNYVSKEEAFKIFSELNKNDPELLDSISASILPASLEIKAKDIDDLPALAEEYNKIDGVEEVKFFKDVLERFRNWSNIAYTIGFALSAVFLIISFSVIIITLRVTINSKGEEYEILKLVGASDEYVKKPLIRHGMFFGIVSGLIAASILAFFSLIIMISGVYNGRIEFAFLPDFSLNLVVFTISLGMILITSGAALGYFGSLTAIKKYLKY